MTIVVGALASPVQEGFSRVCPARGGLFRLSAFLASTGVDSHHKCQHQKRHQHPIDMTGDQHPPPCDSGKDERSDDAEEPPPLFLSDVHPRTVHPEPLCCVNPISSLACIGHPSFAAFTSAAISFCGASGLG